MTRRERPDSRFDAQPDADRGDLGRLLAFETCPSLLREIEREHGFPVGSCQFGKDDVGARYGHGTRSVDCVRINASSPVLEPGTAAAIVEEPRRRLECLPEYRVTNPQRDARSSTTVSTRRAGSEPETGTSLTSYRLGNDRVSGRGPLSNCVLLRLKTDRDGARVSHGQLIAAQVSRLRGAPRITDRNWSYGEWRPEGE